MRRRISRQQEELPGYDSFLDIVANLVGILIILVMVIGVRAKDALVEAAVSDDPTESLDEQIDSNQLAVLQIESDIMEVTSEIDSVQTEATLQKIYRSQLLSWITSVQREIEERRRQLGDTARQQYDMEIKLAAAKRQFHDLTRARHSMETQTNQPIVLQHVPTPLAKTVFGKEVHFRLLGGRLAYVPMNELIEKLQDEWQQKMWKLKEESEITESIGPIQGFRLKYTIGKVNYAMDMRIGTAQRQIVMVKRFKLIPVRDDVGQPLSQALSAGSNFRGILSDHDPQHTTVTVWTYPDSFEAFRLLKDELFRKGYLTAGRPLPAGHSISGSPQGSRSAAQ